MKVLMFDAAYPPPVIGGKEKQAHLLAKELTNNGIHVEALSYSDNGLKSELHDGIPVIRVPSNILFIPRIIKKLLSFREEKQVLHIHTPSRIGKIMALLGKVLGYTVFFKIPNEKDLKKDIDIWWKLIFKTVDKFPVLEEFSANRLQELGVNKSKIMVVANGIDIATFKKRERENTTEKIRLLVVARLVEQKRVDIALRACKILLDEGYKNWELNILGDGPQRKSLKKLVISLGLEDYVLFHGLVDNVDDWFNTTDIVLLTSDKEGMSNVILESMAFGVPIIVTESGAVKKQLGNLAKDLVVSPNDPMAVANKLKFLIENPQQWEEIGGYLKKRCEMVFSIENVARKYLEQYRKVSRTS